MGKILLLTRREISTFFVTPAAYIVMAIFLAFSAFIFMYFDFRPGAAAAMRAAFQGMAIILIFMMPILTMRSLAEEKGSGTIESLLTTPVTDTQVVVAKFLGCWIVFAAMLLPTLVFPLLLGLLRQPRLRPDGRRVRGPLAGGGDVRGGGPGGVVADQEPGRGGAWWVSWFCSMVGLAPVGRSPGDPVAVAPGAAGGLGHAAL